MTWHAVLPEARLLRERGVAALVEEVQVAVFRTYDGSLFAVGNIDPFTGSAVLSRGIVGNRGPIPTVASPLHKQVFDLSTGRCLDDEAMSVPVFNIRVRDGQIEVAV
jgi:nitrite reductase (NADH) small subunit